MCNHRPAIYNPKQPNNAETAIIFCCVVRKSLTSKWFKRIYRNVQTATKKVSVLFMSASYLHCL